MLSHRLIFPSLLLAVACGTGTGPSDAGSGMVRLTVATGAGAAPSGPALASESYSLGGTTIEFTRVSLVLREIELKRTESSTTCFDDSAAGGSHDDCEEFETGPILLELPLDGSPDQVVTIEADTGTYRELEFEIHKPEDDGSRGQAFLAQHPDFKGVSIRAEGHWNGTPFVFITDLGAEQELDLVPPLRVEAAGSTTLTLKVDLRAWFLNQSASAFVNPATANKGQPAEGLVRDNIRRSFDAYEDEDHDGERD